MTADDLIYAVCRVPAGAYRVGDDRDIMTRPEHTVTLGAYDIGQTTVTNLLWSAFMAADGYTTEAYWTDMGWRWRGGKDIREPGFWHDRRFNQPEQPVVGVTWYEAVAFAAWFSAATGVAWRLPTEVEWEAATRDAYGDVPRPRNYNTAERGIGHPWAVTQPGNTSWCGAHDLCGNVWEWCSTRWGKSWQRCDYMYPYDGADLREDLSGSFARIMRGGSYFDPLAEMIPYKRARYLPGSRASNIGFRLAQTVTDDGTHG